MAKKGTIFQRRLFGDGVSLINDEDGETVEGIISEEGAKKQLNKKSNKCKVIKRSQKGDSKEI